MKLEVSPLGRVDPRLVAGAIRALQVGSSNLGQIGGGSAVPQPPRRDTGRGWNIRHYVASICLASGVIGSFDGYALVRHTVDHDFRSLTGGSIGAARRPQHPEIDVMKAPRSSVLAAVLVNGGAALAQSTASNHVLRLPVDSAAVSIPHDIIQFAPNDAEAITIEYWIKFESTPVSGRPVCKRGCSNSGYTINVVPGSTGVEFGGAVAINVPTPTNVWYHFAATWSRASGRARVFVNGEMVSDQAAGTFLERVAEPLTFGSFCNRGFVGSMDNVRIWSVARSQSDIQRDMRWEYSSVVAASLPGLIGAWSFEGGDGSGAIDDAGRNPNGVLLQGASIVLDDFLGINCRSDLDGSGSVDAGDIGLLLLDFGVCP